MGAVIFEVVAADITDDRIYARAMSEDQIKASAQRIANKRGEVMRAIKRDTDRPETLESWTVRPE